MPTENQRDSEPKRPQVSDAVYAASRRVVWAGVSALFTDTDGRVLFEEVDYRDELLLPGGAVDSAEAPSAAISREVREELGLTAHFRQALAVDWVPPTARTLDPGAYFPGETIHVYDGGTMSPEQLASVRLPEQEVTGLRFVEPAMVATHMAPGDARRALSALRARINGMGPAVLEDGYPVAPTRLDELHVLSTPRRPQRWPWRGEPVTPGLRVKQSWGFLFAPDGRVLVLIGQDTGSACLPGGTMESQDHGDPAATLRREAYEEAAVHIGQPIYLGYLHDDTGQVYDDAGPCARVRMAAALHEYGPAEHDIATGQTYARLLASPEQVAELFDWGPDSGAQIAAVHTAREQLGIPRAARQGISELPRRGGHLAQ